MVDFTGLRNFVDRGCSSREKSPQQLSKIATKTKQEKRRGRFQKLNFYEYEIFL